MFNCFPKSIRKLNGSLENFKTTLDNFLETIPDKPYFQPNMIPGAMNSENQPSNYKGLGQATKDLQP